MNKPIDIVILWVDGNDPKWIMEKQKYEDKPMSRDVNSNIRFESWDNMHLWFRAVETCMPWVNKIFFVTWGHVPEFLDINHPKLKIVKHEDYIPSEYRPTYNSNTIEMNLFRIEELSENFILFNDDMIPISLQDEFYYFKDDIVCDEAVENIITTASFGPVSNLARYNQVNNMFIINKYFKKQEVQKKNWDKWYCEDYEERLERTKSLQFWRDFPGFYDPHVPSAMKKSVLRRLWELEPKVLDTASRNRFRNYSDVTQYLVRYWQICSGDFYPRKTRGKVYFADVQNYQDIAKEIREKKYPMICINENCSGEEFVLIKKEINDALEWLFPEKSSYERT
ncbi:MAG: stealth family protein [Lachnospiraceae bacterium]|nr:stealth family protein [Lachnospiraceae bacterium]